MIEPRRVHLTLLMALPTLAACCAAPDTPASNAPDTTGMAGAFDKATAEDGARDAAAGYEGHTVFDWGDHTWQEVRADFETTLTHKGPSPQEWHDEPLPEGVRAVTYMSDGMTLKAWLYTPEETPAPAVVYFHGGYALGRADIDDSAALMKAGYVVMWPALRGENGNPGHMETYLGEVDDGANAIRWLAEQEEVDDAHIYAFGHSAGGIVASNLTLYEELPVRHTGSIGGIYDGTTFQSFNPATVRFDTTNMEEVGMRVLLGNIRFMKRPHYAWMGDEDGGSWVKRAVAKEDPPHDLMHVGVVEGDHFSSLGPGVEAYLEVVAADLKKR